MKPANSDALRFTSFISTYVDCLPGNFCGKNGLSADPKEFNDEVKRAVDGAIFGIVGQEVLRALHKHLKDKYAVTPDEIPYRLDTVFEILEHTFGVAGARTLGNAIPRRLYFRYNLQFSETEGYKLQDYLERAKRQLAEGVSRQASHD